MKLKCIKFLLMIFGVSSLQAQDGVVATSAEKVVPLLVGASVPDVQVMQLTSKPIKLKEIVANKPAIIIFYRGGWCPYCNLHLSELRKIEAEIKTMGVNLIAISTDLPKELKKSVEKNKISYSLYSDSKMNAAKAFGIAFKVDDETVEKYKGYKIDLEAASGEKHHLLPVPSVFAVNGEGVIVFSHVNPNYKVRLSSEMLLAAAKEITKK